MKKCPKCELNFITDNQEICDFCKPKVSLTQTHTKGPKEPNRGKGNNINTDYNRSSSVHTWKQEVVYLLRNLGGKAYLNEIYKEFEAHGTRPHINAYDAVIRGTLEKGSRESKCFDGDELFYMVDGKNNGHYGLVEMRDKFDM